MRDPLTVASDLRRRADIRSGDSIAPLLAEAAQTIQGLMSQLSKKPRSSPQHRRLFALIKAAHKHWPESHEVQCATANGLREYLQIKAGFGIPHEIRRGNRTYIWFEHQSIAFDKMPQDEFAVLNEKVTAIIEKVLDVSADQLLEMDRAET